MDQIWSRKEAEIIADGYDTEDPDEIIGKVLGADRAVQFGFRIVVSLQAVG